MPAIAHSLGRDSEPQLHRLRRLRRGPAGRAIAVWEGELPADDEHAAVIFNELLERSEDDYTAPTPPIRDYVETLLARWPDITDKAGVDSPWGGGPEMNNATGNLFHFSLVDSQAADAAPYCAELANAHGLVCCDPEEEGVPYFGCLPCWIARRESSRMAAPAWLRSGWRPAAVTLAAGLVVLPISRQDWVAGGLGLLVAVIVVGAWALGASSGSRTGCLVGAGLIVLLVAVFVISQWPSGLSAPPADWLTFWLLLGGAVCLVALVADRVVHARRLGPQSVPIRTTAPLWRWVVSVLVLSISICLYGCGLAAIVGDNNDAYRFAARDDEVLPLPASLRLVTADHCADGGSSGNCTAEFVVGAADGAAYPVVAARLVDHLRTLGWPLQPDGPSYHACRDVGGILPWTKHCLWLYASDPPEDAHQADPDAVVVYIDNAG